MTIECRALQRESSLASTNRRSKGANVAKYVIQWKNRDTRGDETLGRRLLDVYSKWTPAAQIVQMVSALDGTSGLSIVETDNPMDVLRDTSKFDTWLEFTVTPVVDILDAVPAFNEAIEYMESIPK
jgi:hypothetical protein